MPGGYHNQARMTISSSGTGTFSLSAAVSGFNTFAQAGVIDGEVVPYGAIDTATNLSEKGWGVYGSSATNTLTRNVFISTGGSTSAANFSSSGTQVFIDPSVADLVHLSLTAQANLGGL